MNVNTLFTCMTLRKTSFCRQLTMASFSSVKYSTSTSGDFSRCWAKAATFSLQIVQQITKKCKLLHFGSMLRSQNLLSIKKINSMEMQIHDNQITLMIQWSWPLTLTKIFEGLPIDITVPRFKYLIMDRSCQNYAKEGRGQTKNTRDGMWERMSLPHWTNTLNHLMLAMKTSRLISTQTTSCLLGILTQHVNQFGIVSK